MQTYSFGSGGDAEPPSSPTNLTAAPGSGPGWNLSWTAATDNVGVTAYDVYRDGVLHASLGSVTSYTDTSVVASTTYSYTVKARDAAGNSSVASNTASVTTPAALTFAPTDDTYIQASLPDATAGAVSTIQVDNSPVKHILLKFNVSGLAGRQVTGAKLRLYDSDPSPAGGVFYQTVSDTWSEATATWNTAPATSGSPVASLGAVAVNNWYEVDLSSIVTRRWHRQPAGQLHLVRRRQLHLQQRYRRLPATAGRLVHGVDSTPAAGPHRPDRQPRQ